MGYTGEQKREYQRKWLRARRDKWIEDQGGQCVACGGTESLEIDHKDKHTKSFSIATIWSRAEHIRKEELKKCQVLCEDCHKIKSSEEATTIKHGTINTYERHGCRCLECKEVKSKKNKLRYKEAL